MMKSLKELNFNHLYCFYEAARAKSLKESSKVVGVSPSTASEQIKKLEADLGLQLFTRTSKGFLLTKEGDRLFTHAKEIFEAGSRLIDDISSNDIGGYSVNVGIEETVSYSLATEFCSQYWDVYTMFGTVNTRRQYSHNQLIENLRTGNIDWGVSLRQPSKKNLDFAKIGNFELVFCCSEELYHQFHHKEDIIRNIPFALVTWDSILNETLLNYLKENSIQPKEFIESDHFDYIKRLCQRGRCVMSLVENPLEDYDGLKKFPIGNPIRVDLYALWQKKSENLLSIRKLKELIDSKLENVPKQYEDHTYQVGVSEVKDDLLK
ncbi:MAG: LysR family transcriptional regulator [Halobacteriovoraceae bacterium]|nr:LysR family transcriptional regulator [Halobacteriovoraceae bacterium]